MTTVVRWALGRESLMTIERSSVRNSLLKRLSPDEFDVVAPHLRRVDLPLHTVLFEPNATIKTFIFPESGFASITSGSTRMVEVGLIGSEGVVGASTVLLGSSKSPFRHFVQAAGEALVFDLDAWPAVQAAVPSLRDHLLRFIYILTTQTAQTAFVNGTYHIEARLARWLLMCQDRLGSEEMALTHEFLSIMLGVQRTSVTLALQTLESNGLIRARRGRIEVRDRERLVDLADDGYGLPEAEYVRLFPAN